MITSDDDDDDDVESADGYTSDKTIINHQNSVDT
jgi:hypothetical protein